MDIDYIITNPPYNKTLYLDILEHLIRYNKSSEIVSVNPSQHLTDIVATSGYKKRSSFSKYKNGVYKHIKDALYFSKDEFDRRFSIDFGGNGAIYYIIPNETFDKYKYAFQEMNENGYFVHGVIQKILQKVIEEDSLLSHYFLPYEKGNLVAVGKINNGFIDGELLFKVHKCVYKSKEEFLENYCGSDVDSKKDVPRKFINFSTQDEAQNFIDCFETEFMKIYIRCVQIDYNTALRFIPLLDMSEKWTNERLCEYYNVSEEEFKLCLEWFKS